MKEKLCRLNLRGFYLIFIFTLTGLTSFGQIDSVSVDIHFETGTSPVDSMLTTDVLHVDALIHDIDFLGEVITVVYENSSNYPVSQIKMSLQDFIDENQKSGSAVTTLFYGIDPQGSYRIETHVRNYQGANFPIVTTNHNIQ